MKPELAKLALSQDELAGLLHRGLVLAARVGQESEPEKKRFAMTTRYLLGEEQRRVKDMVHQNLPLILGMSLRGFPSHIIAVALGVTEPCVDRHRRHAGVNAPKSIANAPTRRAVNFLPPEAIQHSVRAGPRSGRRTRRPPSEL